MTPRATLGPGPEPATRGDAGRLWSRQPRPPFGSAWRWPRENVFDCILALLQGPAPPQGWPVGPFFHDAWIRRGRPNWKTLTTSVLWHVAIILIFPLHIWLRESRPAPPLNQRVQVSWMGSSRDLLPYLPPKPQGRRGASRRSRELPRREADASHPRQTILSNPSVVNHPRQTLIQPAAPPEPPKILTPLPDVVQWPSLVKPVRPRLRVNPKAKMRQRLARPKEQVAMPEVRAAQPDMLFTSEHPDLLKPKLEVHAGARPKFAFEKPQEQAAAPEPAPVQNDDLNGQRLVALSTNPAPPPPILEVPVGNLAARFAVSPDGKQPGAGADSGLGAKGAGKGGEGKGPGIPGIAIVGGNPANASNIAGPGGLVGPGLGGSRLPRIRTLAPGPGPRPGTPAVPESGTEHSFAGTLLDRIKSSVVPEELLEPGRIYTLHVSMPNLESVTGSWTLKFVELDEQGKEIPGSGDRPDLSGPVPLRKVDPKYPPALASAKVEGVVVLYAIIRRDGTVDSIEVVRSVDPLLDQNAMEALARWRFRAAVRQGRPVELAAIVRIPFHSSPILY
jgi:TonB family protein